MQIQLRAEFEGRSVEGAAPLQSGGLWSNVDRQVEVAVGGRGVSWVLAELELTGAGGEASRWCFNRTLVRGSAAGKILPRPAEASVVETCQSSHGSPPASKHLQTLRRSIISFNARPTASYGNPAIQGCV